MNSQYELAAELKTWIKAYSQTDATHNSMCKIKDVRIGWADYQQLAHGSPIASISNGAEILGKTKPERKPYQYNYILDFYFLIHGDPEFTEHHLCDCVDRFRDYFIAHPQMYLKSVAEGGVAAKNIYLTICTDIGAVKTLKLDTGNYCKSRSMNISLYEFGM